MKLSLDANLSSSNVVHTPSPHHEMNTIYDVIPFGFKCRQKYYTLIGEPLSTEASFSMNIVHMFV